MLINRVANLNGVGNHGFCKGHRGKTRELDKNLENCWSHCGGKKTKG